MMKQMFNQTFQTQSIQIISDSDLFENDDSIADRTFDPVTCEYESWSEEEQENEETKYETEAETEDLVNTGNENANTQNRDDIQNWSDTTTSVGAFNVFTGSNFLNPNIDVSTVKSPNDMFQFFLNNDILDTIVAETNRYAAQKISEGHTQKSRIKAWKEMRFKNVFPFCWLWERQKYLALTFIGQKTRYFTMNLLQP